MEEVNKRVEEDLSSIAQYEETINKDRQLVIFDATRVFKSVKRAIRRGHVTPEGIVAPNRPFNNRGNTSKRKGIHSRVNNELKKSIYEQYKFFNRASLN